MDFYDEEYEDNYKPRNEYIDDRARVLVDLALVIFGIAVIIELFKMAFE